MRRGGETACCFTSLRNETHLSHVALSCEDDGFQPFVNLWHLHKHTREQSNAQNDERQKRSHSHQHKRVSSTPHSTHRAHATPSPPRPHHFVFADFQDALEKLCICETRVAQHCASTLDRLNDLVCHQKPQEERARVCLCACVHMCVHVCACACICVVLGEGGHAGQGASLPVLCTTCTRTRCVAGESEAGCVGIHFHGSSQGLLCRRGHAVHLIQNDNLVSPRRQLHLLS